MSLTVPISSEDEAKLLAKAQAAGVDAPTYAARVLRRALAEPRTLEELSGPVYKRFLDSGVSDDQLGEELELAKHAMRAERRARRKA